MDYFVCYSQTQQGVLRGKAGVVVSADNIVEATKEAIEVVKTFSEKTTIASGFEEKVEIYKIIKNA